MIHPNTPISQLRNFHQLRIDIANTQDGLTLTYPIDKMDKWSRFIYDVLDDNRDGDLVDLVDIENVESDIDYMISQLKAAKTALK